MVASLGLEDELSFALRPWGTALRIGAAAAARVLGSFPLEVAVTPGAAAPADAMRGAGGPEISPDPAALAAFLETTPGAPFAMLNLNVLRERAAPVPGEASDAERSGEEAYSLYMRTALWEVMRRGGALLFVGEPVGLVVGAPGGPFDRPWHQIGLVYYPSRHQLRDMLADPDYQAALPQRAAALERALVVPTQPLPGFSPDAR
jgi:uncharacterized protein (DUF1330 family)